MDQRDLENLRSVLRQIDEEGIKYYRDLQAEREKENEKARQHRQWVFITQPRNWEICCERLVFGFYEGYRETVARWMACGDHALVYVTSPVKGIVAAVRIERITLWEEEDLGWTSAEGEARKYPVRV